MNIRTFIQANSKQLLGAKIAKACIELNSNLEAEIINVDTLDLGLSGLRYKRDGSWRIYNANDLQSFTLVRFLPPTLMDFKGFALVIDPDIFAINRLDSLLSKFGSSSFDIMACKKKALFDSSVMLLNCNNLRELSWDKIIYGLRSGSIDYKDLMCLNLPDLKVASLERIFNSLDTVDQNTVLLHTTNRMTQPWKTGLRIDFSRNNPGYFGPIPRKLILKLSGKWPSRYQPHPDKGVEQLFFILAKTALENNYISLEDLQKEISLGNIRGDFLNRLDQLDS